METQNSQSKKSDVVITSEGEIKKVVPYHFIDPAFITPAGNKMTPVLKRVYSEEFKKEIVVQEGETDIDEFIQASASSTDLELLKRQAVNSGIAPEVIPSARYGIDTSLYPEDIHELYRLTSHAKEVFAGMDEKTRGAFTGAEDFIKATIDGSAQTRIGQHYAALAKAEAEAAAKKLEGESK